MLLIRRDAGIYSPFRKMQIELWDIERPKDYPNNARKWSAKAVEKVAASIKAFGWRQPVVVDKDEVIVIGHLRRTAGRSIGEKQCPVHVAGDLSPAQIKALRLADNRTRWQNITGRQAILDGNGSTFEHVKYARRLEAQDAIKEECYATETR